MHKHDVLEVIPRTFNDEEALQIINKVVSGLSGSEAVATNRSVVLGKFKVNLPTGWSIYRTETDSVEFNGEGRSACGFSLKDIADFGVTDEIASQYDDDTLGKIIINYLAQVIPDSNATVTANGINVLRYWQSLVSGDRVAIAYISKGTNLAIISAYDTDETVSYNMVDSLVQQISIVP